MSSKVAMTLFIILGACFMVNVVAPRKVKGNVDVPNGKLEGEMER